MFLTLLIAVVLPGMSRAVAWEMGIKLTSTATTGSEVYYEANLGENTNAVDGYDWYYDVIAMPPYGNPNYVMLYFPHTTWGSYNGNYSRDIRNSNPILKTWSATMLRNGTTNNNYVLSWTIPPLLPDYYSPKLIYGTSTIDMRTASSFAYSTPNSSTSCSIRMDFNNALPYLQAEIPDLLFSDNQTQSLTLNQYFGVLTGSLSYAVSSNSNLIQSIETVGQNKYWQVKPVTGWHGTTAVTVTASANGYNKNVVVQVTRDDTNSPPAFSNAPSEIEVLQNQSTILSWADGLSDPDLDNVSAAVLATDNFNIVTDQILQQAIISPIPGYHGTEVLQLSLDDGVNVVTYDIPVVVQPSTPQPVQNIRISKENDNIICSWDAVETDIAGLPVSDILYRISVYTDPACSGTPINSYETHLLSISMPDNGDHMFINVISANE